MIDIHSHIIPKIDDGSDSFKETYAMIEEAARRGFTDIITTTHYMENAYEVDAKERSAWVKAINQVLEEKNIGLTLHVRKRSIYFTKYSISNKR